MGLINPQYLNNWKNDITVIDANEVKGEFLNLYELVNGNLDGSNIKAQSITSDKIAYEAVTNDKIKDVAAAKITGKLTTTQLPDGLFTTSGGSITGTITFQNTDVTPFIRSYRDAEVVIAEIGTGANKISIVVNPIGDLFQIRKGTTVMFSITADGTVVPKKLQVPVI